MKVTFGHHDLWQKLDGYVAGQDGPEHRSAVVGCRIRLSASIGARKRSRRTAHERIVCPCLIGRNNSDIRTEPEVSEWLNTKKTKV